jgi:hypothetical protein
MFTNKKVMVLDYVYVYIYICSIHISGINNTRTIKMANLIQRTFEPRDLHSQKRNGLHNLEN